MLILESYKKFFTLANRRYSFAMLAFGKIGTADTKSDVGAEQVFKLALVLNTSIKFLL